MRRTFLSLILLPIVLMAVFSCATTPETGRRQLMLVGPQQMHALGDQAYDQTLKEQKVIRSGPLYDAVVDIGRQLAIVANKDFDWEFNLIDSPQINAFCLPGGKIAVYTGILDIATTNAELAAILGHEIAHAVARHGAERMSQALMTQGAMQVTNVALNDHPNAQLIMAALGVGAQIGVMLPYSRKHELEADHIGTQYAARAGYDPRGAAKVWQKMARLGGAKGPQFLSTHPLPGERVEELQKEMKNYLAIRAQVREDIATAELPRSSLTSH